MYFHEIMFVDRVYDLETLYQKKRPHIVTLASTLALYPVSLGNEANSNTYNDHSSCYQSSSASHYCRASYLIAYNCCLVQACQLSQFTCETQGF